MMVSCEELFLPLLISLIIILTIQKCCVFMIVAATTRMKRREGDVQKYLRAKFRAEQVRLRNRVSKMYDGQNGENDKSSV